METINNYFLIRRPLFWNGLPKECYPLPLYSVYISGVTDTGYIGLLDGDGVFTVLSDLHLINDYLSKRQVLNIYYSPDNTVWSKLVAKLSVWNCIGYKPIEEEDSPMYQLLGWLDSNAESLTVGEFSIAYYDEQKVLYATSNWVDGCLSSEVTYQSIKDFKKRLCLYFRSHIFTLDSLPIDLVVLMDKLMTDELFGFTI